MSDFVMPDAIAIDANGYWWRVRGEDPNWSMVPTNPDNSPIPKPVHFFRLVEIPDPALPSGHAKDCAVWDHFQCACPYRLVDP